MRLGRDGSGARRREQHVQKDDVDVIVAELKVLEDDAATALQAAVVGGSNGNVEGQQWMAAALRRLVMS